MKTNEQIRYRYLVLVDGEFSGVPSCKALVLVIGLAVEKYVLPLCFCGGILLVCG